MMSDLVAGSAFGSVLYRPGRYTFGPSQLDTWVWFGGGDIPIKRIVVRAVFRVGYMGPMCMVKGLRICQGLWSSRPSPSNSS